MTVTNPHSRAHIYTQLEEAGAGVGIGAGVGAGAGAGAGLP